MKEHSLLCIIVYDAVEYECVGWLVAGLSSHHTHTHTQ